MHRAAMRLLVVSLAFLGAAVPAGAVKLDEVPTPRSDGWVVDLAGLLETADLQALNRLGEEVKAQTGAELAVAVIRSTDGVPHRQFATDLANRWGLGDREKDNGVLVFAALEDHAAEITLGDGIDDAGTVTIALDIMQAEMVPRFRSGDARGAVLAGALACARRILGAAPTTPVEQLAAPTPFEAVPATTAAGEGSTSGAYRFTPLPVSSSPQSWSIALFAVVGGGIALIFGGIYFARRRPRRCSSCQTEMVRLEEEEDDAHLSSGEQAEERVGSVDYDVWVCPGCEHTEKVRYGAFFSSYASCPQCDARTVSESSWVETEATTRREGRRRVDERCEHCDYRHSYERSIPRLEERSYSSSSSRSSSSFLSSSSSGSSSSSSSSRSGGSSSGGGHSAGSGASGRW